MNVPAAATRARSRSMSTIARFSLLETRRTRLPWIWAAVVAAIVAASLFVHQIAITESDRLQWTFYAAGVRLAGVLTLALYITSSMLRELNEKGLDMLLALDVPRGAYVAGKLAAFCAIALAMALLAAIPLAASRPLFVAAAWGASYACELAIVGAFALFCALSFAHLVPAALLTVGFYLLARSIDALRLMAESALLGEMTPARSLFELGLEALALLLPALGRFTATEWVAAAHVDGGVLATIALQSAIYVALLFGACLFDFERREL